MLPELLEHETGGLVGPAHSDTRKRNRSQTRLMGLALAYMLHTLIPFQPPQLISIYMSHYVPLVVLGYRPQTHFCLGRRPSKGWQAFTGRSLLGTLVFLSQLRSEQTAGAAPDPSRPKARRKQTGQASGSIPGLQTVSGKKHRHLLRSHHPMGIHYQPPAVPTAVRSSGWV